VAGRPEELLFDSRGTVAKPAIDPLCFLVFLFTPPPPRNETPSSASSIRCCNRMESLISRISVALSFVISIPVAPFFVADDDADDDFGAFDILPQSRNLILKIVRLFRFVGLTFG
jgi:hypothetical protein